MQRRSKWIKALAIGCLAGSLIAATPRVQARQGAPSMAGMADAARKRQAEAMKQNYQFSDAQIKQYFQKEEKINTGTQAQLTALRKKMVATKDKEEKRRLIKGMRGVIDASDKKMHDALLGIATPSQRKRIASSP